MAPNYNHGTNVPNTSSKEACASPATTKSESYSKNGMRLKAEEHDEIISPLSSSRRGGLRRIIAPSGRDQQLMRQVSGLDLDDFDRNAEKAEESGIILTGAAAELGGIIAPTREQRQLMRQVSGLGLEDPIFGKNLHMDDSINKEHESFFFEDMDINDIPEDMRDMFSLASDRTDVVETEDVDVQSYDSKSFGSMPPLGLEETLQQPQTVKKIRKGKKPRRKSRDMSTAQSITSDPNYVPPAPAFEPKSKRRGSNDISTASYDRALNVDQALAAQVNAILSMHESKNSNNFSSHSRGHSGHSRGSYGGTGPNRPLKKGTRPKPRRQDSRFSVHSSSAYIPPSMHSDSQSQRGERYMPESMDEIFASSKHSSTRRVKKKKSTRSTEEKKKKKKAKGKPLKAAPRDPDMEVS